MIQTAMSYEAFFGMAHLVQILASAGISFNTTKQT